MEESPTQFAWACCDAGDYPPPVPKGKSKRYGPDDACWLCGGDTLGVGWPHKVALAATFCDHNSAKRLDSGTVCQACAATSSSAGWEQYVSKYPERGLWTHFPDKGNGKAPRAFNWLYASHVFTHGYHESPDRKRWREILVAPPEPPFLMVMAINGKKQILFRGRVSYSRDAFWVQADETRILVNPNKFAECLLAFENLYNHGFSKDSIVSGQYHTGQLMKVGLKKWRRLESEIKPWREHMPTYLIAAHHCGQRSEEQMAINLQEEESLPIPQPVVPQQPVEMVQTSLF